MHRAALFWGVCIPLRVSLYRHARGSNRTALRLFAAVVGGRWLLGLNNSTRGFFGGHVWWKDARPLHGALWSAYAATNRADFLLADVIFGIATYFASV